MYGGQDSNAPGGPKPQPKGAKHGIVEGLAQRHAPRWESAFARRTARKP